MAEAALDLAAYKSGLHPVWCPGCGDFGVLTCIYRTLVTKQIPPEQIVIVSGIGCSGRLPAYVNAYGFHAVHGRVLPTATALKAMRPELTVFAAGGDGDAYSIGGGHIPHAARRNPDLVYIVMDNEVYGLTKGQSSATGDVIAGTTPYGTLEEPLNPLAIAIAYNVSFVARGYSGKPKELADLIGLAMDHKGFALLEVLSPCTTFHDTYKPISQAIRFIGPEHDPADRKKAFELALEKDSVPLGVFYKDERPTLEDRVNLVQKKAKEGDPSDLATLVNRFV